MVITFYICNVDNPRLKSGVLILLRRQVA